MRPLQLSVIVAATAALAGGSAGADDSDSSMLNSTQEYVNSTAQSALANRNAANDLYHRCQEHRHAAHHHHSASGAPDPGLLAQALKEGEQALSADKQAQELAKDSIAGTQSASQQAAFSPVDRNGNPIDIKLLQYIASGQNSEAVPTFSNSEVSSVTAAAPTTVPTSNVTSAQLARPSAGAAGSAGSSTGQLVATSQPINVDRRQLAAVNPLEGALKSVSGVNASGESASAIEAALQQEEEQLQSHRASVLQQMGKASADESSETDVAESVLSPLRAKNEDIFQVVHTHYKTLRESGGFYELHAPAVSPGPPTTPPPFSRGI